MCVCVCIYSIYNPQRNSPVETESVLPKQMMNKAVNLSYKKTILHCFIGIANIRVFQAGNS